MGEFILFVVVLFIAFYVAYKLIKYLDIQHSNNGYAILEYEYDDNEELPFP